jgi:hypothetical protein
MRGVVQTEVNALSDMTTSFDSAAADRLKAAFDDMLPKIHDHARIHFRDIKCADQRADKIAETVAWFGSGTAAWPRGAKMQLSSPRPSPSRPPGQ